VSERVPEFIVQLLPGMAMHHLLFHSNFNKSGQFLIQNKMKKQLKKIKLNKRTISNLNASEMKEQVGGARSQNCGHTGYCTRTCTGFTQNGYTCNGNCI